MEKKSSLQFLGYKVKNSHIEFLEENSKELKIRIDPEGVINNETSIFSLTMKVFINDKNDHLKINVDIVGQFKFNNREDSKIEDFLYLNAPAILFPYVRAYINTLTSLSGNRPVVLPTLNLSGLRENLKNNTTEMN